MVYAAAWPFGWGLPPLLRLLAAATFLSDLRPMNRKLLIPALLVLAAGLLVPAAKTLTSSRARLTRPADGPARQVGLRSSPWAYSWSNNVNNRYSVSHHSYQGTTIVQLAYGKRVVAKIAPSLGANMFQLKVHADPILQDVSPRDFFEHPTKAGCPILQPFVNRLESGSFVFDGVRHQLELHRNGLVRNAPWRCVSWGASNLQGAWVRCEFDSHDFAGTELRYPFAFKSAVSYHLQPSGIEIWLSIRNMERETRAPFSQGLHPYFAASPDSMISVPARSRCQLVNMLPTGKKLSVHGTFDLRRPRRVEGLALDDLFTDLEPEPDGRIRCRLRNGPSTNVLEFGIEDMPYAMVYTPTGGGVCIEPYTSMSNFAHQTGAGHLLVLEPGEEYTSTIRIYQEPRRPLRLV